MNIEHAVMIDQVGKAQNATVILIIHEVATSPQYLQTMETVIIKRLLIVQYHQETLFNFHPVTLC